MTETSTQNGRSGSLSGGDPATGEVVTVYVRRVAELGQEARTMSFDRPRSITVDDALDHGFAVDGRALVKTISKHSYDGEEWSLIQRDLLEAQLELRAWLKERGYQVEFA